MGTENKEKNILTDEELKEVAGGKIFSGPCWKKKNKLDCEREIACFWTIYNQCIKNI